MIFAAGLGTRLRPLTDHKPKALIEIEGRPLLEIVLDKLATAGFSDIVVNVHHFADQAKAFLNAYKTEIGLKLRISDESDSLLNTGGGLKHAFEHEKPNDPVLVHNVDILSNADVVGLYKACERHDAVLLVSERETQRYLLFDESMRMVGWTNVKTGEVKTPYADLEVSKCRKLAFAGIHVVAPSVFDAMQSWPDAFSIMDFYISTCDRLHFVGVSQENLHLLDVGKVDALRHAHEYL